MRCFFAPWTRLVGAVALLLLLLLLLLSALAAAFARLLLLVMLHFVNERGSNGHIYVRRYPIHRSTTSCLCCLQALWHQDGETVARNRHLDGAKLEHQRTQPQRPHHPPSCRALWEHCARTAAASTPASPADVVQRNDAGTSTHSFMCVCARVWCVCGCVRVSLWVRQTAPPDSIHQRTHVDGNASIVRRPLATDQAKFVHDGERLYASTRYEQGCDRAGNT